MAPPTCGPHNEEVQPCLIGPLQGGPQEQNVQKLLAVVKPRLRIER